MRNNYLSLRMRHRTVREGVRFLRKYENRLTITHIEGQSGEPGLYKIQLMYPGKSFTMWFCPEHFRMIWDRDRYKILKRKVSPNRWKSHETIEIFPRKVFILLMQEEILAIKEIVQRRYWRVQAAKIDCIVYKYGI